MDLNKESDIKIDIALIISIISIVMCVLLYLDKADKNLALNALDLAARALIKSEKVEEIAENAADISAIVAQNISESSKKIERTAQKADDALTAAQKADKIAQDAIAKIRSTREIVRDINKKIEEGSTAAKVIEDWIYFCKLTIPAKEIRYIKSEYSKEEADIAFEKDCNYNPPPLTSNWDYEWRILKK